MLPDNFPEPVISSGVGEGWWPIIVDLDRKLRKIAPDYVPVQIKEKFGALRYYIDIPENTSQADREAIDGLIRQAELLSGSTCEICGNPGENRAWGGTWYHTLCPEHAKEYHAA